MALHTFTVTEMHLPVAKTHTGIEAESLGEVLSHLIRKDGGMGTYEITSVPGTKCWCGATATLVNSATDASDEHLACDNHVKEGYTMLPKAPSPDGKQYLSLLGTGA